MSQFSALSQLTKHGWTEGNGLGRNEHGMAEAIKVNLKFDTKGIGHDAAEEFTYHWWDHAFNKAAENINVDVGDGDVKIKKCGDFQISAKKQHTKSPSAGKSLLYGRFVKSGTLNGDDLVEEKQSSSSDDSDSDSNIEDKSSVAKLTDEQLFKICGGLTAHKGARHGLKASGKLQRIMEQEQGITPTETPTCSPPREIDGVDFTSSHKKKSKKKKSQRKAEVPAKGPIKNIQDGDNGNKVTKKKKKHKKEKADKKRKRQEIVDGDLCEKIVDDDLCDESDEKTEVIKKKKKKKSKAKD